MSTSGKPTFHQTPTSRRKTGGGAQNPLEPSSEEDEEEVRYLTKVLKLGPQGDEAKQGEYPAPAGAMPCTEVGGPVPPSTKRGRELPGTPGKEELPRTRKTRRSKLRKKVTRDKDHEWELARQDAWLIEMLTDSSGSESEEKYARFAESGRWIAEMTGIPQQATTTSRGECSGQEKPDS